MNARSLGRRALPVQCGKTWWPNLFEVYSEGLARDATRLRAKKDALMVEPGMSLHVVLQRASACRAYVATPRQAWRGAQTP